MRKVKLLIIAVFFLFSGFSFLKNSTAAGIIVNPNQVYSFAKMTADISRLKNAYPDLIQVSIIGKSEYGRNLYAIGLGKGPATTFINGAHDAREWMTTNLNMYMINQYAEAYANDKAIVGYSARSVLTSATIWFVPMVNPDGVTLQQEELRAFPKSLHPSLIKMNQGSKNFKRWKANATGIDLNRQYNAGWKDIKSPKVPKYKDYKGKAPESAAEVKAILKFVNQINPEMAVAYHSSGKILYWNYNLAGSRYTRDLAYAKKIGSMTGYRLIYPEWNPSGGGFTDWFINSKKKPGFTPEISKSVYEANEEQEPSSEPPK
ncbi:M14 family zinc carboxypeptidase [Bacillus sp. B-jedd]|uniref:M14 family zinc carboxypeptidase n=1 Tax=Bacillus sp. B-jedd TaxID=1476857 RepID=UPI0005156A50|nr:M14 family zinc carboxypeptidase [Bacillus sp. B-jedd]CEG29101.1 peptidase M14 carboxypeptidase A [Bacillus sp. B-jedd]